MIDFTVLKIFWWVFVGLVLIFYATTAGYDAGVTMFIPFLKKEIDRRVVLNTSAPTWEGNLSWIVFAGGGLFVVWPVVYSTAFSGFYAAMLIILWSLFFRPTAFDYRGKIKNKVWREFWDWALFISGGLPVFIFGLLMGNCFFGFPFHFDPITFRDYYTGNFWGLLNSYGILSGVVAVLMVLMHGAAYLQRRTEGHLCEMAHRLFYIFATLTMLAVSVSGLLMIYAIPGYTLSVSPMDATLYPLNNVVSHSMGAWIASYQQYPWKVFPTVVVYLALFVGLWANYRRRPGLCFWSSACAVGGIIATGGAMLFPFIMPSSTNPDQSLTVWNSTSSQYSLTVMFYIGVVMMAIVFCYKIFSFYAIWSKKKIISAKDLEEDKHTYY